MRRRILGALGMVALMAIGPPVLARPNIPIERLPVPPPPDVSATSWVLFDDTNGIQLAGRGEDERRPMASTTKIMTGLVAFENLVPGQEVVISQLAEGVGESEVGLVVGETVDVEVLIKSLLIRSGNDAAIAVAEAVGGSEAEFVALMNRRAESLGLANTRFANPHGLDDDDHYSSARDLLTMARAAMDNERFAEAVATRRLRLPNAPDGTDRVAEATNKLLFEYEGAIGVKTGFTFDAGRVLVAAAERNSRRLYAVVMGSDGPDSHFVDASALLDYGFDRLRIVPAVLDGAAYRPPFEDETSFLERQAAFESLVHLAALGRSVEVAEAPVIAGPDVVALHEPRLPSLSDAIAWFFGGRS